MKKKLSSVELRKAYQETPSLTFRAVQAVVLVLGVASMTAWAFLDFNLDNFSLAWIGVFVGLIIGWLFERYLESKIPVLKKFEKTKKSSIGVFIVLIFIDMTPLAAQQFNRRFFNREVSCRDFLVMAKSGDAGAHNVVKRHWSGYHIDLLMNGVKTDIDCQEDFYNTVVVGKDVRVCTAKGALGIDYIMNMAVE